MKCRKKKRLKNKKRKGKLGKDDKKWEEKRRMEWKGKWEGKDGEMVE